MPVAQKRTRQVVERTKPATKRHRYESDTSNSELGDATEVSKHRVYVFACYVTHDSSNDWE